MGEPAGAVGPAGLIRLVVNEFLIALGVTVGGLLLGAALLHIVPRLGSAGAALGRALCRAPWLDIPMTYFTALPIILGPALGGWEGLGGAVLGQVVSAVLWCWLHELANRKAVKGPRIVTTLNRIIGRWRNHAGLWVTTTVTPVFWIIRMAQLFIYPVLSAITGLPKYRQSDWVNLSRHKFDGLVGHDLLWCWYCDWMTGLWSLGSEMLRNVESFWCPIRFDDAKKCENCRGDFPDIAGGWVPADGTMADVTRVIGEKYADPDGDLRKAKGGMAWFGHPARLTVEGKQVRGGGQ